jgi:uncharacterized metal-binding protein YceD (DUF177 family)
MVMDDAFKIYIEQLRDGQVEKLEETLSADFLDVHEKELTFPGPVKLAGEAYLAEDNLVLHLDVACSVELPCAICNRPVRSAIRIVGHYHTVPLEEAKSGIYSFREALREVILLETPQFAECNQGNCPERKEIAKYLKKPSSAKNEEDEEGYQPFANLK